MPHSLFLFPLAIRTLGFTKYFWEAVALRSKDHILHHVSVLRDIIHIIQTHLNTILYDARQGDPMLAMRQLSYKSGSVLLIYFTITSYVDS